MTQYIDKDVLVAKIEQFINAKNSDSYNPNPVFRDGRDYACMRIIRLINTLEVKEVDINKEISQFIDANFEKTTIGHKLSLRRVAKHFFELGVKTAQKGE